MTNQLTDEQIKSLEQMILPMVRQIGAIKQQALNIMIAFATGAGCPDAQLLLDTETGKITQAIIPEREIDDSSSRN